MSVRSKMFLRLQKYVSCAAAFASLGGCALTQADRAEFLASPAMNRTIAAYGAKTANEGLSPT